MIFLEHPKASEDFFYFYTFDFYTFKNYTFESVVVSAQDLSSHSREITIYLNSLLAFTSLLACALTVVS